MAEKKQTQNSEKAAFLAALEKKKNAAAVRAGESHTDSKGAAKGAASGSTRRIERRRSGSS